MTPVTGTFWQATQPVSGTVTANLGSTNFGATVLNTVSTTNLVGSVASSTAYSANLVVKASGGVLQRLIGYNSFTNSQFVQIFNLAGAPSNGAVPVLIFTVPAGGNFSLDFPNGGLPLATGIVLITEFIQPQNCNW